MKASFPKRVLFGFALLVAVGASLASITTIDLATMVRNKLGLANGGTNADLSASGAVSAFLAQNASHVISARTIAGADLPNPSSTTLGGVESYAAVGSQWINQISTSGVPSSTQPAASDLSNGTTGSGAVVLGTGPTLSNPIVGTQSAGDNSTKAASTAYVDAPLLQHAAFFPSRMFDNWNIAPSGQASPVTSNNQVYVWMFVLQKAVTINKISCNVTTLSASDKWGFGIYSADGLTKLVDSGVIAPTGTGIKTTTISAVTLFPGVYYFAQGASGTTAAMDYDATGNRNVMNASLLRTGLAANAFSSVTGLPSTLGALSNSQRAPMLVFFEN